jgi:hypothetical protein
VLFCELALAISVHVEKDNRHDNENEVCNQYGHPILNKITSQYKRIYKSVWIIQNIRLFGKRGHSNFTEIMFH